jgi:ABC-2 type transport system permease protein
MATTVMRPGGPGRGRGAGAGIGAGVDEVAAANIAALVSDAPTPRPTLAKTFWAMMTREFRVLRRNAISTLTRAVMQPLLFVFVFAYVLPKIGGGMMVAGAGGGVNFATILVPGLMASILMMQGIFGTTMPLVMEFSWRQRTIEDRALAPVPIRVLAIQKILAGSIQSFIGACIVFPIVLFVHAAGQAPHVNVTNWALLLVILVFGATLTSSLGLLLGTLADPRKMQTVFAVILLRSRCSAACTTRGPRCTRSGGCRSPRWSTRWSTWPRGCARC